MLVEIFIKKLKMVTGSRDLEKFSPKSGLSQIFMKKLKMATGSWDLEKFSSKSGLSQISKISTCNCEVVFDAFERWFRASDG